MLIVVRRVTRGLIVLLFSLTYAILFFYFVSNHGIPILLLGIISALLFLSLSYLCVILQGIISNFVEKVIISSTYNHLIFELTERMKFISSLDDFTKLSVDFMEGRMDFSLVLYDIKVGSPVYLTQNKIASNPSLIDKLLKSTQALKDGLYFFDSGFSLKSDLDVEVRGMILVSLGYALVIFNSYLKVFDHNLVSDLYKEFSAFIKRLKTMEEMFRISSVSKEWEILKNIQLSFLPRSIPNIDGIDIKVYYKPLVNVSGDFYDVINVGDGKVVIVVGDVSGKGLSASLISSISLNAIRFTEDKEDLPQMIRNIDFAIKSMRFEDKYVTIFLGLIDIVNKRIRYVNAGIPHPLVLRKVKDKAEVNFLNPNMTIIGLFDIDETKMGELELSSGDTILIATDGLYEATNKDGIELFDSSQFKSLLPSLHEKSTSEIITTLEKLLTEYTDSKIRDDVTLVAARIG